MPWKAGTVMEERLRFVGRHACSASGVRCETGDPAPRNAAAAAGVGLLRGLEL
jgi:hypothetical protein